METTGAPVIAGAPKIAQDLKFTKNNKSFQIVKLLRMLNFPEKAAQKI